MEVCDGLSDLDAVQLVVLVVVVQFEVVELELLFRHLLLGLLHNVLQVLLDVPEGRKNY